LTRNSDRPAKNDKIVIAGAAGLVGQNLTRRLVAQGYRRILGFDKHPANTALLGAGVPGIEVIEADLALPGKWQRHLADANILVLSHAQISGVTYDVFERNNLDATSRLLEAISPDSAPFIIHISSSAVGSQADDFYSRSKRAQEVLVRESGLTHCILRPTLMFGSFDRKHLGWLRRFLERTPIFPVPGDGAFIRQPLYVGDFCDIVMACMAERPASQVFEISGLEHITYIEIIRTIRRVVKARTPIVKIPYSMFWGLLWIAGKVLRDPPFTTQQLEALVLPETFPMFDWPTRFGVRHTPFEDALRASFLDPEVGHIALEF
jgi:nucleoside-diphosphate-sugar epimerase